MDGAGNESEHKSVQFRIDKTAPRPVVIESPSADKRRLEVEATDATSGVGEVQIGVRRVGSIGQANALRRLAGSSWAIRRSSDAAAVPGKAYRSV